MTTTTTVLASPSGTTGATANARASAFGLHIAAAIVNGAATGYIDEGSGPLLALLHGAPVTSLEFARVIRELRSTHRVVAPDLPGFGGSELPPGSGGTLDECAHFVVELVRELGLRDLVMYVNDSSGCIGVGAATCLEPGTLRGLVVADTVPIPLTGAAWFVGLVLRYVITSQPVRWLNRKFNFLAWMVATVARWLNPFSRAERMALTREFNTPAKRDRALDLFEHMAVDKGVLVPAGATSPIEHRRNAGWVTETWMSCNRWLRTQGAALPRAATAGCNRLGGLSRRNMGVLRPPLRPSSCCNRLRAIGRTPVFRSRPERHLPLNINRTRGG